MRSLLFEPWDRSRRGSWVLVLTIVLIAVLIGFVVWDATRPTAAPATTFTDDLAAVRRGEPGLRVLFIGNSLTSFNDLPEMVKKIAATNTRSASRMLVVPYTPAGATLAQTVADPQLLALLTETHWDVVVLQEQSQTAAGNPVAGVTMGPDIAGLDALIRRDGAVPLLYETWGWANGDPNLLDDSYQDMQARTQENFAQVAATEHVDVAPVGDAFASAIGLNPTAPLWAPDGNHPTLEGSYLAAAVLSSEIRYAYSRHAQLPSPEDSTYTAGLPDAAAAWLRSVAGTVTRGAARTPRTTPPPTA